MTQSRFYSSTSGTMTLTGSINASTTSVVVDTVTGLPGTTPFTIIIDPGLASMEICTVTAVGGTTLTVTRGQDGTSGQSHSNGATVRHGFSARDFDDSRAHEASTAAHGATGAVVGTTNTQALTNKDLTSGTNTFPTSLATLTGTQALTNKDLTDPTNVFPTSLVTLSGTQTLTNKTITGGTVNPTTLQKGGINVPTISETATLTNKTMSGASNTFSSIPESAVTNLTTDLSNLSSRLTIVEADTGWITTSSASSFQVSAGWTLDGFELRKMNGVVSLMIQVTRSGATISSNSSGNITNVGIGTLNSAYLPRSFAALQTCGSGIDAGCYVQSTGVVGVGTLPPNSDLVSGQPIWVQGSWITSTGT